MSNFFYLPYISWLFVRMWCLKDQSTEEWFERKFNTEFSFLMDVLTHEACIQIHWHHKLQTVYTVWLFHLLCLVGDWNKERSQVTEMTVCKAFHIIKACTLWKSSIKFCTVWSTSVKFYAHWNTSKKLYTYQITIANPYIFIRFSLLILVCHTTTLNQIS